MMIALAMGLSELLNARLSPHSTAYASARDKMIAGIQSVERMAAKA